MSGIRVPPPALAHPSPQPAPARRIYGNLGLPGLLVMLAGLAVCVSFVLPWLTASLACTDPLCSSAVIKSLHFPGGSAASPSGFAIATSTFTLTTGGPFGTIHEGFSFLLLWLVFLVGVLLVVLPALVALRRVDAQRTRVSLVVLSLLALVVELVYGLSAAQALPQTRAGVAALLNGLAVSAGRQAAFVFSTGPGAGFWLALGATLVALGASSYTLYAPAATRRFNAALFAGSMGLAGQVGLIAGLALVVIFFLPWLSTPDPTDPGTAWSEAANGIQTSFLTGGSCVICQAASLSIFTYLWLIPVAALSLVLIVWLLSRGVLWRRLAALMMSSVLLVALALEVFFLLEVQSLHSYAQQVMQASGQQLTGASYSANWGFWVALLVTGGALLVSGFLLLVRHKSVTGRLATN